MTEVSPSLLLSDAAQPGNGVNSAKPVYWPGGELSVMLTGPFSGASVQIVCTMDMPPKGKIPADPKTWKQDADWIKLADPVTTPTLLKLGHINPCMLSVLVAGSQAGTRVKALVS